MSRLGDLKERHDRLNRQALLSAATGTAGLLGLSAIGTSAVIRRPHAFRPASMANKAKNLKMPKKPDLSSKAKRIKFADDIKDRGYIAGSFAGGIGGVSSLNFAHNQIKDAKDIEKSLESARENRTRAAEVGATIGGGTLLGLAADDAYNKYKGYSNMPGSRVGAAVYRRLPKKQRKKLHAKAISRVTRGNIVPATAGAALLGGGIYLNQRRKRGDFKPYDGYFDRL